jgi:putative aminopeptidase FrvX
MLATEKEIWHQSEIPDISEGKTNFEFLQKGSIPGCVVNIPTRNQHQAKSVANFFDIQNAINLIKEIVLAYDSDSLL